MFKINSFGNGTVGPATCGHVVTLRYQLLDINNNLLSENTKTFTLGSRAIMPGLDSVVVGMMVGQNKTSGAFLQNMHIITSNIKKKIESMMHLIELILS